MPARSQWILSPWADGVFIIGAPIWAAAAVLAAAGRFGAVAVFAVVMTFGSVGHHLPGFLRTYGDRELFADFKWRFVVAPVLLFAVMTFATLRNLHGMALITLVWSIWHGMMQNYGFARIYSAKGGESAQFARLDLALTVSWFGFCLVYSPHQSASILDALYASGITVFAPAAVRGLTMVMPWVCGAVTAWYLVALWRAHRAGQAVSVRKLALLVSSTSLVVFARVVTRDPFVSVAMFEVLHDAQYLAIVWGMHRTFVRQGKLTGAVARMLYAGGGGSALLYLGACAAYGAGAYLTHETMGEGTLKSVLVSALLTSGILHFYYDGFIWKLRGQHNRTGLGLGGGAGTAATTWRRDAAHVAALVAVVAVVFSAEARAPAREPVERSRMMAVMIPGDEVARHNYASDLLDAGEPAAALVQLREALALRPDFPAAREALSQVADAHFDGGEYARAAAAYALALEHDGDAAPGRRARLLSNRGLALAKTGRVEDALADLERALALDPGHAGAHLNRGLVLDALGKPAEAARAFLQAAKADPTLPDAYNNLGGVLLKMGEPREAIRAFQRALTVDPDFAPARHNLAAAAARLKRDPSSP